MGKYKMNSKNRTEGIDNMGKVFVVLLASLIVMLTMAVIFTNVALANVTDACYTNITAEEAKQMIDENQSVVILDVRTLAEYKSGHIDGSKLIPLLELEERINAIDGNSAVIVYCRSGIKSEDACNILVNHGYEKVYKMMGGLNAWEDAGFPIVYPGPSKKQAKGNNDLGEIVAEKIEHSGKVKIELFMMSQCPFGVMAEKAIVPILEEFGEQIDFKLYFIACEDGNGGFRSLHGQPGVEEDIRQVVMAKYYPDKYFDYVMARADNYQSDNWEQQAADLGIDHEKVNEITSSAGGEEFFRENIKKGNELGIGASPTLLIDDEKYTGTIFTPTAVWQGGIRPSAEYESGYIAKAACTVPESAYECKCPEGSTEGKKHKKGYVKVPNGCSVPFNLSWKDNPVGLPGCSFKDACDEHDCCYGTCNSNKATCDNAFYGDMMQICTSSCLYAVVSCTNWATIYYGAVVAFGGTAYSNNQDLACEKCWCCPEGTPNAGTEYTPQNPEDGCCAYSGDCRSGTLDPEECRICYGGTWSSGEKCCDDGNCHECCTDADCPDGQECVDYVCEEVPEFPAGVTAVFGAALFIFLMMRRKYIRK